MTVLEDPAPAPRAGAVAGVPAQRSALQLLPLGELRARRAELRRESSRAHRWERLVQARLDLAADALLPAEALAAVVDAAALRTAVHGAIVPDLVDDLHEVAAVRRELLAYTEQLRSHLQSVTDELLARYAEDPAQCLGQRPGPRPA